MNVGQSVPRVDAKDKTTGEARYAADLEPRGLLYAKVARATIANGWVKSIDIAAAERVPGVVKIITCMDVPETQFPTPGHPWSVEPAHQDVRDRRLLNRRVRVYGDDIAAVVAETELAAKRAVALIRAEYEEYAPLLDVRDAMAEGAPVLHEEKPGNVLVHSHFAVGGEHPFAEAEAEPGLIALHKTYETQTVQHCHLECAQSFCYMESGRLVVVTSTQIPHIVRRVIGQALDLPLGGIRVVKPYIGGGFGNKQDVLYEPLNAYLCLAVGGRPVKLELTREETLACTRVRHAIRFELEALARKDGTLVARRLHAWSNQGGYASHGHAIVANAGNAVKQIYHDQIGIEADLYTVYTNRATAGAMRGYGVPQGDFAAECMADDLSRLLGMDPIEFRLKNRIPEGYVDPHTHIAFQSYGLLECLQKGRERFHWDEKRAEYAHQTGPVRRGVGMAMFCYKTGVYPISLETAACRMTLNQDGSVMLHMGATEIGQGADTVFTQMAADTVGVPMASVHIVSSQDTDSSPFDTGAYASRQTYVSGQAVKQTGELLKRRVLDYAAEVLAREAEAIDLRDGVVVDARSGEALRPLSEIALEAQYSLTHSVHITAETTYHCKDNTFSSGACFCEVEVDIPLGKVRVLRILNAHDSGVLINPKLAEAQVHGGMSMGLGFALSEELLYNEKGRPLNDNLLDYKLPTSLDTPELETLFVEMHDPSGPFGNKALGEPPACPVAGAVRNAVLHATGVGIDRLPLSPQHCFEAFQKAGLL